jgi:pSer/pThr/pTyr-binding forkhead associated (FHA) protein
MRNNRGKFLEILTKPALPPYFQFGVIPRWKEPTMAFLIISVDKRVTGKRELTGSLVVGRSADCGLSFPSMLLSRQHIRLEPTADGWVAIDLGSKNGSYVRNQKLARQLLRDGDIVALGNVMLEFSTGTFITDDQVAEEMAVATSVAEDNLLDEEIGKMIAKGPVDLSDSFAEEEEAARLAAMAQTADAPQMQPAAVTMEIPARVQSKTAAQSARPGGPQQKNLWNLAVIAAVEGNSSIKTPQAKLKSPATAKTNPTDTKSDTKTAPNPPQAAANKRGGFGHYWNTTKENFNSDPRFKIGISAGMAIILMLGVYLMMKGSGIVHDDPLQSLPKVKDFSKPYVDTGG